MSSRSSEGSSGEGFEDSNEPQQEGDKVIRTMPSAEGTFSSSEENLCDTNNEVTISPTAPQEAAGDQEEEGVRDYGTSSLALATPAVADSSQMNPSIDNRASTATATLPSSASASASSSSLPEQQATDVAPPLSEATAQSVPREQQQQEQVPSLDAPLNLDLATQLALALARHRSEAHAVPPQAAPAGSLDLSILNQLAAANSDPRFIVPHQLHQLNAQSQPSLTLDQLQLQLASLLSQNNATGLSQQRQYDQSQAQQQMPNRALSPLAPLQSLIAQLAASRNNQQALQLGSQQQHAQAQAIMPRQMQAPPQLQNMTPPLLLQSLLDQLATIQANQPTGQPASNPFEQIVAQGRIQAPQLSTNAASPLPLQSLLDHIAAVQTNQVTGQLASNFTQQLLAGGQTQFPHQMSTNNASTSTTAILLEQLTSSSSAQQSNSPSSRITSLLEQLSSAASAAQSNSSSYYPPTHPQPTPLTLPANAYQPPIANTYQPAFLRNEVSQMDLLLQNYMAANNHTTASAATSNPTGTANPNTIVPLAATSHAYPTAQAASNTSAPNPPVTMSIPNSVAAATAAAASSYARRSSAASAESSEGTPRSTDPRFSDVSATELASMGYLHVPHRSKEQRWMLRYEELRVFQQMFGHCRVPHGYKENRKLAWWVMNHRAQYQLFKSGKKSWLTEDKMRLLDAIGFEWNPIFERSAPSKKRKKEDDSDEDES